MVNYQLYRTNILLGGQMKYDLILGNNQYGLAISDFHITPISDKVPYNKYIKDNLLNYTHQDNISKYYKSMSGSFYKDYANPELTNLYPLISNDSKNYEDTYELGCRRMKYNLYNKQFSYLCPLWIEKLEDDECLAFKFTLYTDSDQKKTFSEKIIYIDNFDADVNETSYHNKFIQYFNNYMKYIGCIGNGNDWVINVKEGTSEINGISIETGMNRICNSPIIYQNLISRERPLIEQNNMIINELPNNKLIVKQLFNFNFCFDLIDLCQFATSYQILNSQLKGKNLYISLDTYICKKNNKTSYKVLECRDMFSNHDYIKKICCTPTAIKLKIDNNNIVIDDSRIDEDYVNLTDELKELNVLNYLMDYECVDLIDKNKIVQNTIHWSTVESPEITFNFYNGFAGYVKDGDKNIMLKHTNAYTPDLIDDTYKPYLNQYWCNAISLESEQKEVCINFIKDFINMPSRFDHLFSNFGKSCTVKNIHYQYDNTIGDIKALIIINNINKFIINEDLLYDSNITYYSMNKNSGFYLIIDETDPKNIKRYIIFVFNKGDKTYLPIKKIRNILDITLNDLISSSIQYKIIDSFNKIISSDANLKHIYVSFPAGLSAWTAPSPSLSSTELEYYKNDKSEFIERNIGKIKPTFIKDNSEYFFNYKFKKITIGDAEKIPGYFNYQNTGYSAKYPSIGFYPFKKEVQSYNVTDNKDNLEYNNFNFNKVLNLVDVLDVSIDSVKENGILIPVKTLVTEYIKNYYQIQNEDALNYILGLYDYTCDFEYADKQWDSKEGPNYIYDIKIKLK